MAATANERVPRILSLDAGGTITDTFLVDDAGSLRRRQGADHAAGRVDRVQPVGRRRVSVLGSRRPPRRSRRCLGDLLGHRDAQPAAGAQGARLGLLVTAGFEDYLRMERGIQTYLGYSYSDRLHVVTHATTSRSCRVSGSWGPRPDRPVRRRADRPLRGRGARGRRQLLDADVEGICVNLLFGYVNPAHEQRVRGDRSRDHAGARRRGPAVPAPRSSIRVEQDFARLNTVLIEAYAAEPSRGQFSRIQRAHRASSAPTSSCASWRATAARSPPTPSELARTLVSGPIGGVVGARYLANALGFENVSARTSAARASTSR